MSKVNNSDDAVEIKVFLASLGGIVCKVVQWNIKLL